MKILLAGGGTLGSVVPLIAIFEEASYKKKKWSWFWVGTRNGPEREFVKKFGIDYEWIPVAKLRRYASLRFFIDPFLLIFGFFRCVLIMIFINPDIVIGAGSFVSVPVIWAAWVFRKKIIIHQQDIKPSLSNIITSWCASKITVSFKISLDSFSKNKTELTGNPVRREIKNADKDRAVLRFGIDTKYPTVLVVGGSSGAKKLNEWVWDKHKEIEKRANLIHIAGKDKINLNIFGDRYFQMEFIDKEMSDVLALSDIVVSRAGIGTISELCFLGKASFLVPINNSHQVDNATYFARIGAAYFFREDQICEELEKEIFRLLDSKDEIKSLEEKIKKSMKRNANIKIIEIIENL